MFKRSRRRPTPASHPNSGLSAPRRELTTKRRGELAELAFTFKAAHLGFGVSRPVGDSERYDVILDARELLPNGARRCNSACPIQQALLKAKPRAHRSLPRQQPAMSPALLRCPALRVLNPTSSLSPWCPPHPMPPLWRVQVKCSTQLTHGLYRLNAHRRTGGRAVPYRPGEIDFLAAWIIPEDSWYILPLEAFLGCTSLLFRRQSDPKPSLYDEYKEAWRLLRPK